MIYFSLSGYYSNTLEHYNFANYEFKSYSDGENYIQLAEYVTNQDCYIVGDITQNSQLFKLTMLAETIQEQNPKSIKLILPYLAYSRQDKQNKNQTTGIIWLGKILKSVGIDQIITIDVHSKKTAQLIKIPLISLDAPSIFEPTIRKLITNATIVAPDEGAQNRAQKLADVLNVKDIVSFKKSHVDGIDHTLTSKILTNQAIIVDDILATGKTLVSCAKKLKEAGVKDIIIVVTHGLFRGDIWQELWQLGINKLLVSNSLELPDYVKQNPKVIICPITNDSEINLTQETAG